MFCATLTLLALLAGPPPAGHIAAFVNSKQPATRENCAALAKYKRADLIRYMAGEAPRHTHSSISAEMEHQNVTAMTGAAITAAAERCAVALAALPGPGAGCNRSAKRCKRPAWNGENVTASEVVMWSAALWAFDEESTTVVTPCGGGLSCAEVAEYVQSLGGKVLSACPGDCAVFWQPTEDSLSDEP